ncbi:MAG: hypothetical protein NVV60_11755 [Luteimonas sp.]|nr:hypothetical protein [Luteimonas sp.]
MRKPWLTLFLVLVLLGTTADTFASREGILPISAFALESPGIGGSGPVKVSGAQSSDGISLLRVEAFGKQFTLRPEHLKELQGFGSNGVKITYEGGYVDLGGRTIYVIFSRGFTSGQVAQKYVALSEDGSVSVGRVP